MIAAFFAYFCMYAFRKPFSAATYEGLQFFGTNVDLKTAFVIFQIIGYASSKYLGIKVCPEVTRGKRAMMLVGLILAAELSLVLFAVLPNNLKVVAIFFNGLSLGMVWGLVVWYLEGRQTSEILLAVLSCSFIVSSGVVKDVGRALLPASTIATEAASNDGGWHSWIPTVSEFWMPAVTGLIFFIPFLASVWLLNQIPEPNVQDIEQRSLRKPMTVQDRLDFVRRFLPGLVALIVAYVLMTAFRDFRDNYTVEVLNELGLQDNIATISTMETSIALAVLASLALVFFIKDNRRAMQTIFTVITLGVLTVGLATYLRQQGLISGYWWMFAIGLGSYLAYVPYGSVLFDRLMASTRATGTAVFAIYIADALGYTGSVAIQIFNDLFAVELSHLAFLEQLCYVVSAIGSVCIILGGAYFLQQQSEPEQELELASEANVS